MAADMTILNESEENFKELPKISSKNLKIGMIVNMKEPKITLIESVDEITETNLLR